MPVVEASPPTCVEALDPLTQLYQEAVMLMELKQDHNGAEKVFKQVLEQDPAHVPALCSYGMLLIDVRKEHTSAEALFKRALGADPNHVATLGNYARLLHTVRRDPDAAEALFQRALKQDPADATALSHYANLLKDVRRDADGASHTECAHCCEMSPLKCNARRSAAPRCGTPKAGGCGTLR
jgi:cytochrome c-type biogenesis protein CcmH/NrfG